MEIVVGDAPAVLNRTNELLSVVGQGFVSVLYSRHLDDSSNPWHFHTYEKGRRLIQSKCAFVLQMDDNDQIVQAIKVGGSCDIFLDDGKLYLCRNGEKHYVSGNMEKRKNLVQMLTSDGTGAYNKKAVRQVKKLVRKNFAKIKATGSLALEDVLQNTQMQTAMTGLFNAYGAQGVVASLPYRYYTGQDTVMDRMPKYPVAVEMSL